MNFINYDVSPLGKNVKSKGTYVVFGHFKICDLIQMDSKLASHFSSVPSALERTMIRMNRVLIKCLWSSILDC